MIKLVVFDLDGTLAESKSSLDAEMANLLASLMRNVRVAVISGGDWPQFENQLLSGLPEASCLEQLSLLPTCGTKFYRYDSGWQKIYSDEFSHEEKARIIDSLRQAVSASGFRDEQIWGEQIEDRGSQITFSALGQQAPIDAKKRWDPDFSKRHKIKSFLDQLIPGYSVRLGGTTSVDVTGKGIDKAYGIGRLHDLLGISIGEMIFIGDALFPGGNDHPVKQCGVMSIEVRDPGETKQVVETILAGLHAQG